MQIFIQEQQEFRWDGERSASRDKKKHYCSFLLDEERFSIEDFVLVRNDDSVDPEDITNCYVGRIKELYDTGDEYEPHQAKVQWYSRVTELPPYTLKNFDEIYEHELIEENRPNFSGIIDADTIFGKCEVNFLPLGVDFTSFDAMLEECDIPTFFCRYKFSGNRLYPIAKNDENPSQHNSPVTSKKLNGVSQEKSSGKIQTNTVSSPNKGTYMATATGTEDFPRVLIKRIDNRLLETCNNNVRIIVAKPNQTIEDIADTFKNSLSLNSPAKTKSPVIHSLSNRGKELPPINNSISGNMTSPRKSNSNTTNRTPSKRIHEKTSKTSIPIDALLQNIPSPKKSASKRLPENIKSSVPIDILSQNIRSPKKSASKQLQENIKSSIPIETLSQNIPPPKKSSQQLQESSRRSQSYTPKKTPKVETFTPTRCSARVRNNTPKRLSAAIATAIITPSPLKSSKRNTPKRVAAIKEDECSPSLSSKRRSRSLATPRGKIPVTTNNPVLESSSPNKRKKTPSRVPSSSPCKTPKSARRSINFSDVGQGVAVTRSGRKTKAVNYFAQQNMLDENCKSVLSNTIKKSKLSKFIRINYSDDSGSEYSAADSSGDSEDEGPLSDGSFTEKDIPLPRSTKKAGNKTSRTSSAKKISELSIPVRKTPLKTAENVLEESRLRLHVAAVPKSLPCREEEFADIYSFVKGCLSASTGGCMYISGVPGTGKTATVHEVIRNLEVEKEGGDVPHFTFVEVNGMWMTDPYQCYVHIFKSLTGKTIASQQAANLLEKRFTESGPKKEAVILLVDELDRLWTRKQTVMYNIFDWPSKKHSKLIVLAIANTMDLPERLMMNRISSRLGLTRKTFQPYNFRQLQEIIMSRIQELQVFDPDAVQFVARKVAAVSGDARRALDICRHATEVAESTKSSPKKKRKILVGMEHVDEAIQQMFSSPVIAAIKSSSKVAQLFLQGMLSEFTRTGVEETTLLNVSSWVMNNYFTDGMKCPSSTEISNVCSQLSSSHLILVDNFQNDIYMKLRLSVSPDDVNYALTGKSLS